MAELATKARMMPRSGIREIMDTAWGMAEPVIGLHVGEPNFDPPSHVLKAAQHAYATGDTHYVPNAGVTDLRRALASRVSERYSEVSTDQIIISNGGMQALYLALSMTVAAGDEVLIPDPGWPNFAMAIQLLQANPIRYTLNAVDGFGPNFDQLEKLVDSRTKAIIINSPSNPLGTVLSNADLQKLVDFANAHDIWLISDECYEDLVFEKEHVSPAQFDLEERVLSCYSFSKSYAMTGLRVGYVVAPRSVTQYAAKLQEPILACVNAPAQKAALEAVRGPQDAIRQMRSSYLERRDIATGRLDQSGVGYLKPQGAFYLWVDVRKWVNEDVKTWALELLREQHVAVAPGSIFGPAGVGWIRISLATKSEDLLEGLGRITQFIGLYA